MLHRLAIALVTLLGLTGGTVVGAYLLLFAGGADRAARLAPAETVAYATVYLTPTAGQQMNLAELLGRFPGFADDAALDTKVDQLVQNLVASQLGLDYREQIKPWLGDQLAFAWVPVDGELPPGAPITIAEVTDADLARRAIADAMEGLTFTARQYRGVELHDGGLTGFVVVDDMLLVGSPNALETMIDVSLGADALASRPDFRRAMAALPADHLASGFVDIAGLAAIAGVDGSSVSVPSAGAALVAETDGLRVTGSGAFAAGAGRVDEHASSLVEWMPPDTIAEATAFGLGGTFVEAVDAVAGVDEARDALAALDLLRAAAALGLGIDLDADVRSLLDGEAAVALSGFDGERPRGQVLLRPLSPGDAADVIDRLLEGLGGVGTETSTEELGSATITTLTIPEMGDVAFTSVEDVVIIGLTADDVAAAIEAHDTRTSLGTSAAYRRSFDRIGERAGNEGWADVQALLSLVGDSLPTDRDVRDMLGQLETFGFTMPSHADHLAFHAALAVE